MTQNVVLFSGPGGVSTGLKQLGIDSIGYEISPDAVDTAFSNGLEVVQQDVRMVRASKTNILQASPPCPTFSVAGKKAGREDIDTVLTWLRTNMLRPHYPQEENAQLLIELFRWIRLEPEYIMFEQVVSIEPVWEEYANILQRIGYYADVKTINMADYGLPQIRRRSILMAKKEGSFEWPHIRPHKSMHDVLGWDGYVGFPRKYDRGAVVEINGTKYRGRDLRHTSLPSLTLTEKARSWKYYQKDEVSRQLFINEAKILQGFNKDFAFVGSRTSQFLQCANALPPSISKILFESLLD